LCRCVLVDFFIFHIMKRPPCRGVEDGSRTQVSYGHEYIYKYRRCRPTKCVGSESSITKLFNWKPLIIAHKSINTKKYMDFLCSQSVTCHNDNTFRSDGVNNPLSALIYRP
jgi:hypothetical protein